MKKARAHIILHLLLQPLHNIALTETMALELTRPEMDTCFTVFSGDTSMDAPMASFASSGPASSRMAAGTSGTVWYAHQLLGSGRS